MDRSTEEVRIFEQSIPPHPWRFFAAGIGSAPCSQLETMSVALSLESTARLVVRRKSSMTEAKKSEVLQGTLDLMILKTLHALGPLHGFGIARRIEQVSRDLVQLNEGTVYTSLLRLLLQRWIAAEWGKSENNRKAKFYSITTRGGKQLCGRHRELGADFGCGGARAATRRGEIAMGKGRSSRLRTFAARVVGLLRLRKSDSDLDEETQAHFELLVDPFVAQGMSRKDAGAAARRQFGNTTLLEEDRRELRTPVSVEDLGRDVRSALRSLGRSRAFTAVAIATLGLWIGALDGDFQRDRQRAARTVSL
jgi:transcriptional regulator